VSQSSRARVSIYPRMEILSLPNKPNKIESGKMNSDLLELLPRNCPDNFVVEGIVLVKLIHLQLGCTLPLVVAMNLVKSDDIFIT
jgi:hypothetical protein